MAKNSKQEKCNERKKKKRTSHWRSVTLLWHSAYTILVSTSIIWDISQHARKEFSGMLQTKLNGLLIANNDNRCYNLGGTSTCCKYEVDALLRWNKAKTANSNNKKGLLSENHSMSMELM